MTAVDDTGLRCTDQARTLAVDPAGTAGHAPAVLAVEAPLPWPKDVADHPALVDRAARGEALVVLHRAGDGAFRGYERHAAVVGSADLAAGVDAVAASQTTAPSVD